MYLSSRIDPRSRPQAAPPQQAKILIIEDHADTADSMRVLLRLLGHEVHVARSGPEGVEEAIAWEPEVVLSDIGLPGLDGYEVARILRQVAGTRRSRLIAISGYSGDEVKDRCREVGFDLHLTKPIDPTVLETLLLSPPAGCLL